MTAGDWVWPDDHADHLLASNGASRYQAYLALGLAGADDVMREDVLGDPVGFALWAWRRAVPPTMSPGYVDWREPISSVRLVCSSDGGLAAELEVRVPPPVHPKAWQTATADLDELDGDRVILGRAKLRVGMIEVVGSAPGPEADLEQILVAAKQVVAGACRSVTTRLANCLSSSASCGCQHLATTCGRRRSTFQALRCAEPAPGP